MANKSDISSAGGANSISSQKLSVCVLTRETQIIMAEHRHFVILIAQTYWWIVTNQNYVSL